jgi:hypothetical protein
MTAPFAHVNGNRVIAAEIHVPQFGCWWADVTFEDDALQLAGAARFGIGSLELVGVIDASHDGTHGRQRKSRILAGAGAWGRVVPARSYHNDAGIRASDVINDLAQAVGERVDLAGVTERIGVDFVRQAGHASRALDDALGGLRWWVGYDGVTRVGERSTSTPEAGSYEVLEHAPDERVVVLAIDDLRTVGIGSVLTERLDTPQTVRGLEIRLTADDVRVRAWCGGTSTTTERITDAIRRMIDRALDARAHGVYRYRVVRMSGDRVELQAISADMPDIAPISMWVGVAGTHARLTQGAEVLVQFVEGKRTQPVITHFAGKDGAGWAPVDLTLEASSSLKLGAGATKKLAFADAMHAELVKIAAALSSASNSGGNVLYGTPYQAPTSLDAIATTKTVSE